ncbi:uncharacterized protein A4U43_C01F36130 [Asparagus officinalis]|uniref:Pentatricopeptide repeat-containing protein n=1 Tax=Asparagus officinalis TaxID=4686 RepID=A0A5P1FVG8_ASPOF|nr:uncharacterized protein A4U43_C01F36130 [Asparagus officinalis]
MHVGKILIRLDPNHGGRYVNLANVLAANGDRNRAAMVRKMMRRRKVLKLPGSSLINVDRTVHEFFAGDRSHKYIEKINLEWNKILGRLKKEGDQRRSKCQAVWKRTRKKLQSISIVRSSLLLLGSLELNQD